MWIRVWMILDVDGTWMYVRCGSVARCKCYDQYILNEKREYSEIASDFGSVIFQYSIIFLLLMSLRFKSIIIFYLKMLHLGEVLINLFSCMRYLV